VIIIHPINNFGGYLWQVHVAKIVHDALIEQEKVGQNKTMPCNNQPSRTEGCEYNSAANSQEMCGWLTRIFGRDIYPMNNIG
jgi:hypothetical protein